AATLAAHLPAPPADDHPMPTALAAHPARRGSPAGAARSTVERRGARPGHAPQDGGGEHSELITAAHGATTVDVLNASRHQWTPHACASASFSCASFGAQRLAASMESSPHEAGRYGPGLSVLNALRHQWNPHEFFSGKMFFRPTRAQRLAASMESSLDN